MFEEMVAPPAYKTQKIPFDYFLADLPRRNGAQTDITTTVITF
jgi:hypothetical protein